MQLLIAILIIISCVLLVLIVLIQKPKGSGLGASFGGSNQIFGVQKTTDILEKSTWGIIVVLIILTISFTYTVKPDPTAEQPESELVAPTSSGLGQQPTESTSEPVLVPDEESGEEE